MLVSIKFFINWLFIQLNKLHQIIPSPSGKKNDTAEQPKDKNSISKETKTEGLHYLSIDKGSFKT